MKVNGDLVRKHFEELNIMEPGVNISNNEVSYYAFEGIKDSTERRRIFERIAETILDPAWKFSEVIEKTTTIQEISYCFLNSTSNRTSHGSKIPSLQSSILAALDIAEGLQEELLLPAGATPFIDKIIELLLSLDVNYSLDDTTGCIDTLSYRKSTNHPVGIVILEGADLDSVIDIILNNTWSSELLPDYLPELVLVQEQHFGEFISRLKKRTQNYIGDGLGGRFNVEKIAETVEEAKNQAIAHNARVGVIENPNGLWSPTIFKEFIHKENPSPTVSVFSFRNTAEALKIAENINLSDVYSIWGSNTTECIALADGLFLAGTVWINCFGLHHPFLITSVNSPMRYVKQPFVKQGQVLQFIRTLYLNKGLKPFAELFKRIEKALIRGPCLPRDLNVLMRQPKFYTQENVYYSNVESTVAEFLALLFLGNKVVIDALHAKIEPFKTILGIFPGNAIYVDTLQIKESDCSVEEIILSVFERSNQRKVIWLPPSQL